MCESGYYGYVCFAPFFFLLFISFHYSCCHLLVPFFFCVIYEFRCNCAPDFFCFSCFFPSFPPCAADLRAVALGTEERVAGANRARSLRNSEGIECVLLL